MSTTGSSASRVVGWFFSGSLALMGLGTAAARQATADEPPRVTAVKHPGSLEIRIAERPWGEYVWQDPLVTRPFFRLLHAPGGQQVTRTHPPNERDELTDHETMHPGMWLSFGDLSGADFWRCQVPVEHQRLVGEPRTGPGTCDFSAQHRYAADGQRLADELARWSLRVALEGTWLVWDSTFTAGDKGFYFGDQEEMGLGLRLTRRLIVREGGTILNAQGQRNEAGAWGKTADWCAYFGPADGQLAGVLVVPDPKNFRPSWFHVRDYGLIAANPFGLQAFTRGAPSRVEVAPGQSLRLRFAVLLFSGPEPDWNHCYQAGLGLLQGTR